MTFLVTLFLLSVYGLVVVCCIFAMIAVIGAFCTLVGFIFAVSCALLVDLPIALFKTMRFCTSLLLTPFKRML